MGHLNSEQRYVISALRSEGMSMEKIGVRIGRDKSVISRELRRNCDGRSGKYNPDLANRKAKARQKEKPKKQDFTEEIKNRADALLKEGYSPEQVSGLCKKKGLICVSPERLYQYVWTDKKRGGTLYTHLRRKGRRHRKRGNKKDTRGLIKDRVSIDKRPPIVEKRERFGDLEADLIIGKDHLEAIVTINDRSSGVLKMRKVNSKQADCVSRAILSMLEDWKAYLYTITTDNGKEFANHVEVAEELGIDFYFAHPYHSWERGSNENLNGLIRQYIPKKTDFRKLDDAFIQSIEDKLNNRPRKRLNYETPIFVMDQLLFNTNVAFIT